MISAAARSVIPCSVRSVVWMSSIANSLSNRTGRRALAAFAPHGHVLIIDVTGVL